MKGVGGCSIRMEIKIKRNIPLAPSKGEEKLITQNS